VDSSELQKVNLAAPDGSVDERAAAASVVVPGVSDGPGSKGRRLPSRWHSIVVLTLADFDAIWRSWLCRGFLLASALVTILELKGLQAKQQTASQMLEAVYVTYILVWMHGVIFIAGSALAREQDCLSDAILSRGITRGEYMSGKLLARCLAILLMIGGVLLPASFWAIRQDKLIRTQDGYVLSHAQNTKVEAWDPKKVFAEVNGTVVEKKVELGDSVRAGDILAQIDDRMLFHEFENERRGEDNARNEVSNTRRRYEDAKRAVAQAEDALTRAERALIAKDLLSRSEQADKETEIRSRKRDLKNTESQLHVSEDAIATAERNVENAQARVRDARKRLTHVTIVAPISGYVTEANVQASQPVNLGVALFAIAPLDEYQVRVPIYKFEDFKRLKAGLTAYVKIENTEFSGVIDRLGATTQQDRWGRDSNFGVVRFKGNGTLGLLGLNADVRIVLPPPEQGTNRVAALMNTLTGSGVDDLKSRTASVTPGWMLAGFAKVMGCACMLVTLTFLTSTLFRNTLVAILGVIGLWHVSNLLFDFAGLPELSYLEMIRTMDKVLGGIANPFTEMASVAWLFGFAASFGALALLLFITRDPPK
jgi:multidrug resistance efflux pump